jgi:hypothetical protein
MHENRMGKLMAHIKVPPRQLVKLEQCSRIIQKDARGHGAKECWCGLQEACHNDALLC